MSFRIYEPKCPTDEHREVTKLTTPSPVIIDNGQTAQIGYPAVYYTPPRDYLHHKPIPHKCAFFRQHFCIWHYHNGWTQDYCVRCNEFMNKDFFIPIHIRQEMPEGTDINIKINLEKDDKGELVLPGLSATASIDPVPFDNVIRVNYTADCPSAQKEKQESLYSLVLNYSKPYDIMRTVILKGKIIVKPTIL